MNSIKCYAVMAMALCAVASHAQKMYRCGNSFSQTPCGENQKEIVIQTPDPCLSDGNKYSMPCLTRELDASSAKTKEEARLKAEELRRKVNEHIPDLPPPPGVIAANVALCETETRRSLKDPDSARIKDVKRGGAANDYFQGKFTPRVSYFLNVNAKNSYGGYTGEKLFSCVFTLDEKVLVRIHEVASFPR